MANLPTLLLLVALLAAASANAQSASGTTTTTATSGSTTGGSTTSGGSTTGDIDMTVMLGGNPKADPAVVKECTSKVGSLTKCFENADFDAAKMSQADATKQFQNGPCSDSCTALSKWASAADNLAKCSDAFDALGLAALAMSLAPMALGQACLTKDSKFCYIEYKYSLQAKGVSTEDFNNDPTKLPKDQACTPCMKAMTQYNSDIAGTMASSSSSSTTDGKTSSSSASLPDTAAIDRINKYCGWDASSSSSGSAPSGTSSTSTTTGGSGAIAVDVKGAGVYVAMLGAAVAVLGM
ncbi:hypothetical protein GGF32_006575 [Allomyces javanicus]|nr:hypothetical protein GGF32_006575 [Allomyces javanicus]